MKKSLFLSAAIIASFVSSCKKKDEAAPETPATVTPTLTYMIYMDSTTSTDVNQNTEVRRFTYNSSKRLIKVEHKYSPSTTYTNYDTLIYNSSGQLISNTNYSIGGGPTNKCYTITYNGSGQMTTIDESGLDYSTNPATAYVKVHMFTYTAGKISGMTSTFSSGANGNKNDTITNIVYAGDNLASVIYDNMPITATISTAAPNPYYGLGMDPTDFVNVINKNNMLQAYLTSDATILLQDATYTYANGRVATITNKNWDNNTVPNFVTDTSTTTITYKGY